MPAALQVALFLASVAFIVLVTCLIPISFQARSHLRHLSKTVEDLKTDLHSLVDDSRNLVRNANELVARTNQQMDDVAQVVSTIRLWTHRTDQLVKVVGAVIEPPVFSVLRTANMLRLGVSACLRALLPTPHQNHSPTHLPKENKHV